MCCTGQSANTWFHNTKTATTKNIKSHSRFSLHQPMNPTKRRQINFCGHHFCLPSLHFPKKPQTPSQKNTTLLSSASAPDVGDLKKLVRLHGGFSRENRVLKVVVEGVEEVEKCGEKPGFLSVSYSFLLDPSDFFFSWNGTWSFSEFFLQ